MTVSLSVQVLRLLADGMPRTVQQIASAAGISEVQAASTLAHSRELGKIASTPVLYRLTLTGMEHAAMDTRSERLAKAKAARVAAADRRREIAAGVRLEKFKEKQRMKAAVPPKPPKPPKPARVVKAVAPAVRPRAPSDGLVARAIRLQPALDMAWMRSPESAGLGGRGEAV